MRTTLTLDEDVAAKLQAESRRTGKSFKALVNEHLRESMARRKILKKSDAFRVEPKHLGVIPGRSYDNIGALLDDIEGPAHR